MVNDYVNTNSRKNIYISRNTKKLDVIIPSRNSINQNIFLKNSIGSIINQQLEDDIEIRIMVCMDPNFKKENVPTSKKLKIQILESDKPSQVHALNAGINKSDSDYVSFLEDDDYWQPHFLQTSLKFLSKLEKEYKYGMTSTNQLEINNAKEIIMVNDFPTPSGWLMNSQTLSVVGLFNTMYTLHLDNDWLGRAALKNIPRFHLIEKIAPIDFKICLKVRPWLAYVVENSKRTCSLKRHEYLIPLVNRLVHSESGMALRTKDKSIKDRSLKETNLLLSSYGSIPW